jgi:hypothetical protein
VSTEFRGGAASRLLRGSLVATLPGLSYQHTSAETLGQDTVEGAGKEALNSSSWRGTAFSGAASVGARLAVVVLCRPCCVQPLSHCSGVLSNICPFVELL